MRIGCDADPHVELGVPSPQFFVSVASKGFGLPVSLLFAAFTGRPISVAAKGLTGRSVGAWRGELNISTEATEVLGPVKEPENEQLKLKKGDG